MTKHTYNWVDLGGFKIIITSSFIEDMKITQEKLKLQVPIPILILVDLLRFNEAWYLSQYLLIYWAYRIFDIACKV